MCRPMWPNTLPPMLKKRDKKKFTRQTVKLRNYGMNDLDALYEEDTVEERRAEKKPAEKGQTSDKTNLQLQRGRICEVRTNNICQVRVGGRTLEATLGGRLKNLKLETRTLAAAGDWVMVGLADEPRIEEIEPRRNTLARYTEQDFQTQVILAANIDQVLITASWDQPPFRPGLVDRYLCAAVIENITPVLCLNKIDLAFSLDEAQRACQWYEQAGVRVLYVSAATGEGMEELTAVLRNKDTVFSGSSGAGKTSLINQLQPNWQGRVGNISDATGKGRHTTTHSRLIPWDFGGMLVDTPGIKTFGLHRDYRVLIPRAFPGFAPLAEQCRFADCTHTHEDDCGVKAALCSGRLPQDRYDAYCRILESLA